MIYNILKKEEPKKRESLPMVDYHYIKRDKTGVNIRNSIILNSKDLNTSFKLSYL